MFEKETEMLTRKAIVDKAITFKNEERVHIWVDGPNIGPSDVLTYDLSLSDPNDPRTSEWGFKRARAADGNWIVPKEGTLTAWDQVDAFRLHRGERVKAHPALRRHFAAELPYASAAEIARIFISDEYSRRRESRGRPLSARKLRAQRLLDLLRDPRRQSVLRRLPARFRPFHRIL